MALPFGPPLLPKAEAACPQWQDTQEIVKALAPQVHWLSIWCNDQATLAQQRIASSHKIFVAAKPGEIVSVNQMESTVVSFFAQLKGSLTKKQYRYLFQSCRAYAV